MMFLQLMRTAEELYGLEHTAVDWINLTGKLKHLHILNLIQMILTVLVMISSAIFMKTVRVDYG